jgi:hypothetical protein
MSEQDVEIGPGTKMRIMTFVALAGLVAGPLVALLIKVERVDMRLERIESHIVSDWTTAHMILWASRFGDFNRTNGVNVPDPEMVRRAFGP